MSVDSFWTKIGFGSFLRKGVEKMVNYAKLKYPRVLPRAKSILWYKRVEGMECSRNLQLQSRCYIATEFMYITNHLIFWIEFNGNSREALLGLNRVIISFFLISKVLILTYLWSFNFTIFSLKFSDETSSIIRVFFNYIFKCIKALIISTALIIQNFLSLEKQAVYLMNIYRSAVMYMCIDFFIYVF